MHAPALPREHWPQAPLAWHAGVAAPQSASEAQAWHVWLVVSQTGVVPPQLAFVVHGTQVAVATLQDGVAPVQAVVFVSEHWPQAPLARQAGVAPPQSASPPHARQV